VPQRNPLGFCALRRLESYVAPHDFEITDCVDLDRARHLRIKALSMAVDRALHCGVAQSDT